jgi:galactonate dehydratase
VKITDIKTFLMMAGAPESTGASRWSSRNWCFVKVYTDEGIVGIGEGSGWPRVVQTAIEDLRSIVVCENPMDIARIWQKMLVSTMGAGMTGTPGSGAINAIDMALWTSREKH